MICARFEGGYIEDGTFCINERKRLEWKYGKCLLEQRDPVLRAFLEKERQKYRKVLDRLGSADDETSAGSLGRQARKKEVEEELALLGKAFFKMEA